MEAVLFDGADRVNDVCCGDKLFTMEVEEESSSSAERSSIGALDFNIVTLLNYVIVNQMMMLLLWRRHYSMAPIVLMMSAGDKLIAWTRLWRH